MNMFKSFFSTLPKNRADFVHEFDQSDTSLPPHVMSIDAEDSLTMSISSISTLSGDGYANSVTTDSSVPISKAMTDSDIDYERYRRYKNRSFSDPWDQLKSSLEAFPPGYLSSLNSFQNSYSSDISDEPVVRERPYLNEELMRKMERFFNEECRVFSPEDPGLLELESALLTVDMKKLESDVESPAP